MKDGHPLPRIDDVHMTLDVFVPGLGQWVLAAQSYRQCQRKKQRLQFTVVMPFGLCNATATFERLMGQVLCGLQWSRYLVYIYDMWAFRGHLRMH